MSATSTTTYTRLSASCQQIIWEDLTNTSDSTIIIRSCMGDPDLSPSINNHKCNNVVMEATLSTHPGSTGDVLDAVLRCVLYSITLNGTRMQENGHCNVRFDWYYGWISEWQNHTADIKSSIAKLYSQATTDPSGTTQLVHRNKAYQLFESFVQYAEKYQNMSEVVFDSSTLEATSLLNFLPDPFTDWSLPYYLDGLCHVSGCVCNAVEPDKDKNAFISNGVGAMKISPHFRPAASGAEIRNYVRMQQLPNDKTVLSGDVYILQDGEIVGAWEGVRFKKIPRRVLNVFLPPPKKV